MGNPNPTVRTTKPDNHPGADQFIESFWLNKVEFAIAVLNRYSHECFSSRISVLEKYPYRGGIQFTCLLCQMTDRLGNKFHRFAPLQAILISPHHQKMLAIKDIVI
jgi:hypothetical protein